MQSEPVSREPLTEVEIHLVLREFDGDRKKASEKLGLTQSELVMLVEDNHNLNTLWGNPNGWGGTREKRSPEPPSDITTLDRPPIEKNVGIFGHQVEDHVPSPEITPDNVAIADAMTTESHRLCRGLEKLGLTEREVGEAFGLADFHGLHFKDSLAIVGGGMTRLSIKYQTLVNHLIQVRLPQVAKGLDDAGMDTSKREAWIAEEVAVYKMLKDIGAECRMIMNTANQGALTQALVRSKYNNGAGGMNGMKKAKPSFSRGDPLEA